MTAEPIKIALLGGPYCGLSISIHGEPRITMKSSKHPDTVYVRTDLVCREGNPVYHAKTTP